MLVAFCGMLSQKASQKSRHSIFIKFYETIHPLFFKRLQRETSKSLSLELPVLCYGMFVYVCAQQCSTFALLGCFRAKFFFFSDGESWRETMKSWNGKNAST